MLHGNKSKDLVKAKFICWVIYSLKSESEIGHKVFRLSKIYGEKIKGDS
jgi:hypothetical protein